jgi:NADH dehydrogenase
MGGRRRRVACGGVAQRRSRPQRPRDDLTLPGHGEIFVIGDTAHVVDAEGKPLPGIAPVAKQQGSYVACALRKALAGEKPADAFRYRHLGSLATIGRKSAVADFGTVRLSGRLAWFLWGAIHIYFLIGFRNRLTVALDWIWSYVTFQRGARLITGPTQLPYQPRVVFRGNHASTDRRKPC